MTRILVSVDATGRRRCGFVEVRVFYGDVLPPSVLWIPEAMGAELLEDMLREGQAGPG